MPDRNKAFAGAYQRGLAVGLLSVFASVATLLSCGLAHAENDIFRDKFITLATSPDNTDNILLGAALCDAVNKERKSSLIRCVRPITTGYEFNTRSVIYRDMTMGFSGTYISYNIFKQKEGPGANLRAVMALFPMSTVMVVRRSAHIETLAQLAGHVVSVGSRGSANHELTKRVMEAAGLKKSDFSTVMELDLTSAGVALCQGKIDAFFSAMVHPSPLYKRIIKDCDGVMIPFSPEFIDRMLAANPMIHKMVIPGGIYPGYDQPVPSFGGWTLLVTSAEVSNEAVQRFVASVINGLPEIKQSFPQLTELDPDNMFHVGVPIPLHQGVINYLNSRK